MRARVCVHCACQCIAARKRYLQMITIAGCEIRIPEFVANKYQRDIVRIIYFALDFIPAQVHHSQWVKNVLCVCVCLYLRMHMSLRMQGRCCFRFLLSFNCVIHSSQISVYVCLCGTVELYINRIDVCAY